MKIAFALIIGSLALASATAVYGQQEKSRQQANEQSERQQPSVQPARNEKSQSDLRVTEPELSKRVSDVNKGSKLIGMQVKNTKNETVGRIGDLAIDLKSGRIAYAVLAAGGLLGLGEKLFAVPLEAFAVEKGAKYLLLDVDKQKIQQAPGFNENNWPNLDAARSGRTIGFSAQPGTNQTNAAGGTGSQGDQTSGRRSSQVR